MSLPSCGRRLAVLVDVGSIARSSPCLPFLYYTPTILKQSTPRRRKIHSYSQSDSVPFDESLGPAATKPQTINDIIIGHKGSRITEAERKVFEQIFEDVKNEESKYESSVDDLILDKRDLDEDAIFDREGNVSKDSGTGERKNMDKNMDGFLRSIADAEKARDNSLGPSYLWPEDTHKTAQHILKRMRHNGGQGDLEFVTKNALLKERQQAEAVRISNLIRGSSTDFELWSILETEVFALLRALRLDDSASPDDTPHSVATLADLASSRSGPSSTNAAHLAIIGPNYPPIMVFALRMLRHKYPTSTLPLSVLPAMRSLGRSSFVLGASTPLYHELIIHYWLKYSDLAGINALLEEMANGVVEFNSTTLDLLQHITREVFRARDGDFGPVMQALWGMDIYTDGMANMWRWREKIKKELPEDNRSNREKQWYRSGAYRGRRGETFQAPKTF